MTSVAVDIVHLNMSIAPRESSSLGILSIARQTMAAMIGSELVKEESEIGFARRRH